MARNEKQTRIELIDECHRSAWGKWSVILTDNPDAVHIGLAACEVIRRTVDMDKREITRAEIEKMHLAEDKQLEAAEALPGAILREVFDFEEVQED